MKLKDIKVGELYAIGHDPRWRRRAVVLDIVKKPKIREISEDEYNNPARHLENPTRLETENHGTIYYVDRTTRGELRSPKMGAVIAYLDADGNRIHGRKLYGYQSLEHVLPQAIATTWDEELAARKEREENKTAQQKTSEKRLAETKRLRAEVIEMLDQIGYEIDDYERTRTWGLDTIAECKTTSLHAILTLAKQN